MNDYSQSRATVISRLWDKAESEEHWRVKNFSSLFQVSLIPLKNTLHTHQHNDSSLGLLSLWASYLQPLQLFIYLFICLPSFTDFCKPLGGEMKTTIAAFKMTLILRMLCFLYLLWKGNMKLMKYLPSVMHKQQITSFPLNIFTKYIFNKILQLAI